MICSVSCSLASGPRSSTDQRPSGPIASVLPRLAFRRLARRLRCGGSSRERRPANPSPATSPWATSSQSASSTWDASRPVLRCMSDWKEAPEAVRYSSTWRAGRLSCCSKSRSSGKGSIQTERTSLSAKPSGADRVGRWAAARCSCWLLAASAAGPALSRPQANIPDRHSSSKSEGL